MTNREMAREIVGSWVRTDGVLLEDVICDVLDRERPDPSPVRKGDDADTRACQSLVAALARRDELVEEMGRTLARIDALAEGIQVKLERLLMVSEQSEQVGIVRTKPSEAKPHEIHPSHRMMVEPTTGNFRCVACGAWASGHLAPTQCLEPGEAGGGA